MPATCAALGDGGLAVIGSARIAQIAGREVCAVSGQAGVGNGESIRFELQLPLADWNGKFAQLACTGSCARSSTSICANVLRRGFACLTGSRPKKPFLSADASHALAVAAKAAINRFYGKPAATNLFLGCGEGSYDALAEAQNFPQDFNAIVASAPIVDVNRFAQDLRARLRLMGARGRAALTSDDLNILHRAVIAKCDADDGLKDGLIGQPLRCTFDPRSVRCGDAPQGECISASAAATAAQIYDGDGGLLPGSELEWAAYLKPGADLLRWSSPAVAASAHAAGAGAGAGPATLQIANFIAGRGKLLLVQGLSDAIVSPRRALRSYEALARASGGQVTTQGSVRLFAVPGLGHCGGGEGTNRINLLSVIETWAAGRSPDDFIAFRALDPAAENHPFAPLPLDGAQAVYGGWMLGNPVSLEQAHELSRSALSRPVFLYPYRVQYKGRGDPKLWMSFFAPGDFALLTN